VAILQLDAMDPAWCVGTRDWREPLSTFEHRDAGLVAKTGAAKRSAIVSFAASQSLKKVFGRNSSMMSPSRHPQGSGRNARGARVAAGIQHQIPGRSR